MRAILFLCGLCASLFLLTACTDEPEATPRLQVGDRLPPLIVQDLKGRPQTLRPSPGRLLILNVWATWCAPCRHELPSLQRLMAALDPRRAELVLLSLDDDALIVREYLIERGLHFTSLMDPQPSVADEVLGVRLFPTTYFVQADGRIAAVIEGARDWDAPAQLAEIRTLLPPTVEAAP